MVTDLQYATYGKIVWLWSNSNLHKTWSTSLQSRMVIPALMLGQLMMVHDQNRHPVAYCSWAMLDAETELKYILNPNSLQPCDWRSGDRLWMIDFISPFSKHYTLILKNRLKQKFPRGVLRALRVKEASKVGRVLTFMGQHLGPSEAEDIRRYYLLEMHHRLKNHPKLGLDFTFRDIP